MLEGIMEQASREDLKLALQTQCRYTLGSDERGMDFNNTRVQAY